MANPEHFLILKQGVGNWNRWRESNPSEKPDLELADLKGFNLAGCNLSGAILSDANLSKSDLSEADLKKAECIGTDFTRTNFEFSDLRKANLSAVIAPDANFIMANLGMAGLQDTVLDRANFQKAYLVGTNFTGAELSMADFRHANCQGAKFQSANLIGAIFDWTNLDGSDFAHAFIGLNVFANINLGVSKSLDTVQHNGPSEISIGTIYRSKGKIPEVFLRGAGVPDTFIGYMSSLTEKALDYYSCFISYSSKDQEFVERLYADLQSRGIRCWFAPEDMKIGDKIWDTIDQYIRIPDKLVLILSENSINSNWVEDEVSAAYEEEHNREKTVLFPIRLDSAIKDSNKPWALKVRSGHIQDFTQWKDHNAYKKAFERLLRDLKVQG